jgi:two-component system phosphate regulon response regulator OmpR
VLRRRQAVPASAPEDRDSFSFGPFKLNFRMRTLFRGDRALSISDTEFALLKLLITHAMQVLTREHIVELMYGPGSGVSDRGIDVQIWRLRRVLDEDAQRPRYIQTVRGRGYTFVPDEREEREGANEVQG